jgi:radical SAM superfamily enzyme YgiQ (UPF0313 family)
MKIALIYPPPWKIRGQGEPPFAHGQGAPEEYLEGDLDADFFQIPYGLLTLASEGIDAGHQVKVINLSAFPWSQVTDAIARIDADVFGMSCWTANRRGVAYVADEIRRCHPKSHIVVGGPHATPFAVELLERIRSIDTVTLGESEATFLELLKKLEAGEEPIEIPGSAYRSEGQVRLGPKRAALPGSSAGSRATSQLFFAPR